MTLNIIISYNETGDSMQKYKLVYETKDIQQLIALKGVDDNYTTEFEICFIDKFTTVYRDEQECINYLYKNQIIDSTNGNLYIRRPKGNVNVEKVIYNDEALRNLSSKLISQLKNGKRTRLPQISELHACIGPTIRFFMDNDNAVKILNEEKNFKKSFNDFVVNLNGYLKFKDQTSYTPGEIAEREKYRNNIYKLLENYDLTRELKVWIYEYKSGKKINSKYQNWKNPYEKYEKQFDEEKNNQK